MDTELEQETSSVNAIYDAEVLVQLSKTTLLLDVPNSRVKLRLNVPVDYPRVGPVVEGPESSAAGLRKGQASVVADTARRVLAQVFRVGEPCMFDLLEELKEHLAEVHVPVETDGGDGNGPQQALVTSQTSEAERSDKLERMAQPAWTLSEVVTERKSVFVARAVRVSSPATAGLNIEHLLATDKKVAKATHNMTAWRMRHEQTDVVYRDCDDDGETAAGSRLLHLLELMDVWNVMVVVTRWYGGTHLGPDRFRIINSVARDAIVKAGLTGEAQQPADGAPEKRR